MSSMQQFHKMLFSEVKGDDYLASLLELTGIDLEVVRAMDAEAYWASW